MNISHEHSSPNFSNDVIPVDFVVLHYTATDLEGTIRIFADPVPGLCAHFVVDLDGTVYDLGHFSEQPIRRGAHAGESRVDIDGKMVTTLNDRSVGIEIINYNGNVFEFTDAQYAALTELLKSLITRYPKLREPGRIVGHEHIAGYRGKCDPGLRFDWARVLKAIGARVTGQHLQHACTAEDLAFIASARAEEPAPSTEFWTRLSTLLEERIRLRQAREPQP